MNIINHNPTIRNAMDSFLSTANIYSSISNERKPGTRKYTILVSKEIANNKVTTLQLSKYSEISSASLPQIKIVQNQVMLTFLKTGESWLSVLIELPKKEKLVPEDFVSSSYHVNRQSVEIRQILPVVLMLLLTASVHTCC